MHIHILKTQTNRVCSRPETFLQYACSVHRVLSSEIQYRGTCCRVDSDHRRAGALQRPSRFACSRAVLEQVHIVETGAETRAIEKGTNGLVGVLL